MLNVRTILRAIPCSILLLFLAGQGCVGYRLGSMLPPEIQTVYVPTFINETDEPLLEIDATQSMIEELQKDGSLRVVGEDQADAILLVRLTDYKLSPLAYNSTRATLAEEYRLILYASVTLVRNGYDPENVEEGVEDGILVDASVARGENTFDFTSDLTQAKRDALPDAAEDLAHDIIQRIVEYWP